MQEMLLNNYEWLRALHIISIIAWMAGLLYLPRLFVYHAEADPNATDLTDTLKIMERRLMVFIMRPAMITSWVFGLAMLHANPAMMSQPWMHVKLTCVILLTGAHHVFQKWMKKFALDQNTRDGKFYRIMNEVPTILMIIIVIAAVVQF